MLPAVALVALLVGGFETGKVVYEEEAAVQPVSEATVSNAQPETDFSKSAFLVNS